MNTAATNRRIFMKSGLVAAGGALAATHAGSDRASAAEAPARAFRFVHFGDTHVGRPESAAPGGYPKALQHVNALSEAPDFILHTGDIVTDAFWAPKDRALAQWDLYLGLMQEHCTLPVRHTLGNHDVNFGWDLGHAGTPFPGKTTAMGKLGMTSPYYSFDHKGWHFIVLDDIRRGGWSGFQHYIDNMQFAWLASDLEQTDASTPVIIATHAPILSIACFFEPMSRTHPDGMVLSNDCIHTDAARLHELFRQHMNVRLCLSGHLHQVDYVQYLGVHHICGGAVCADYWRGPMSFRPEFESGYGVVDVFDNGSFEYRFVDYGMVGIQEDDPARPRYSWDTYRVDSGMPPGGYPAT